MAEVFEVARDEKYALYVGDEYPPPREGEEPTPPEEPAGLLVGSAATPEGAKLLAADFPDAVVYLRQSVRRYVPVDPAGLPGPVE